MDNISPQAMALFIERLRARMDELGLNMGDVAFQAFGTHNDGTVRGYLSGRSFPNGANLLLLANVLRVSPNWLLGVDEWGVEFEDLKPAAPADEIKAMVRSAGWDLMAIRNSMLGRNPSHELIARRLPTIAAELDESLIVTIIDDGRVHWRKSSRDPLSPFGWRQIWAEEVVTWLRCIRRPGREYAEWTGETQGQPLTLSGSRRCPIPDVDPEQVLPSDPEAPPGPILNIRVWPVPVKADGSGPRREVMVTQVET
jgi:transcriptional regulator with XRE-family HTH domain